MEFYDFVVYAFFAIQIGQAFFPAKNEFTSLLLALAVFGVGFFARPLGGVVLGAYADKVGRRPALLWTIGLITVGTLGIASTPSYKEIGVLAPILVVSFRLVQGFALGGEVGPSSALLIEAAPIGRRGRYAGWLFASQGAASFAAGTVGYALHSVLPAQQMAEWGWRIPFLLGLLIIPVGMYLRWKLPETLYRRKVPVGDTLSRGQELMRSKGTIALGILAVIGGTVSTYQGNYMTTYAIATLKMPAAMAMTATIVVGLCTFVFGLVGGWGADRFGRKPVMIWPRVCVALLTVPGFLLLVAFPTQPVLLLVSGVLAALTAASAAATLVSITESLPRKVRATGMSIAYAVGVSIFGGTTQFIITGLLGLTGSPLAPAWYVAAASIPTILAMLAMPERKDSDLRG